MHNYEKPSVVLSVLTLGCGLKLGTLKRLVTLFGLGGFGLAELASQWLLSRHPLLRIRVANVLLRAISASESKVVR